MRISDWSSDVCSSDLREGEIAGPQAQDDVVALEKGLQEGLQRPFEMAERDALVDHQPLDLMEHRRMRRVAVRPIDPARRDDEEIGRASCRERVCQYV